jgi:hypothetical protein
MASLTLAEAIKRYFPSKRDYMHALIDGFNAAHLAVRGAYCFLANPKISPPKLVHACASRDPDTIALALRKGAHDYFDGCVVATMNGDKRSAAILFGLHQSSLNKGKTRPNYWPQFRRASVYEYFDDYINKSIKGATVDYSAFDNADINNNQTILCAAYMSGDQDLIDYFTPPEPVNRVRALFGACRGSRTDLLDKALAGSPVSESQAVVFAGDT